MTDKTNGLGRQGVAVVRLFLGLLPLLAVCMAWTAAVLLDVVVMKTRCLENSLVEWMQFALIAASGAAMAIVAVRERRGRAAYALASAFFFDMAIREMDGFLDALLWHGSWSVLVAVVASAAFAAVFAFRWHGTVVEGLLEMSRSRSFPMLAVGLAVILVVSRIMGMKYLWATLGDVSGMCFAKRIVEESLELFGYCMVFSWSVVRLAAWQERPMACQTQTSE